MILSPIVSFLLSCSSLRDLSYFASHDVLSSMGFMLPHNRTSFHCDPFTHGVASRGGDESILESSATIAEFLTELETSTAISIELWITPLLVEGHDLFPILTIGKGTRHDEEYNNNAVDDQDFVGCDGYDLQISQRQGLLEFSYSDHDVAQTCRVLKLRQRPLVQDERVQVVLVLDQGKTSIFINGVLIIDGARNYFVDAIAPSSWNSQDSLLLFSNTQTDRVFPGSMHKVAFYSQALGYEDVLDLFDASVPEYQFQEEEAEEPIYLVAEPSPDAILVQGRTEETPFVIGSFNASTFRYDLSIEIVTLPSFGMLIHEGLPINATNFRIALDTKTSSPLTYGSFSDDYFNAPTTSFSGVPFNEESVSESFEFRIVATIGDSDVAVSPSVTQDIHVVHLNRAPTLHAPLEALLVKEKYSDDARERPRFIIDEVQVRDVADHNIDRIRVDVWAVNGTLNLSEEYLDLADFESCSSRPFSVWQCFGDGLSNRNMTFLAEPDNVSLILKGLQYTSFFWGINDTVSVRIYDGSGGPCLDELEHQERNGTLDESPFDLFTVHDGCFSALAEIQVAGFDRSDATIGSEDQGYLRRFFDFDDFGLPDLVFWCLLIMLMMACCFCCMCISRCLRLRGANVIPEETLPPREDLPMDWVDVDV